MEAIVVKMDQKIDHLDNKINNILRRQNTQSERIQEIYEEELPQIRKELGGLQKNGDYREEKIESLEEDLEDAEKELERERTDVTTLGEIKGLASSTQAFVLILISLVVVLIGALKLSLI